MKPVRQVIDDVLGFVLVFPRGFKNIELENTRIVCRLQDVKLVVDLATVLILKVFDESGDIVVGLSVPVRHVYHDFIERVIDDLITSDGCLNAETSTVWDARSVQNDWFTMVSTDSENEAVHSLDRNTLKCQIALT